MQGQEERAGRSLGHIIRSGKKRTLAVAIQSHRLSFVRNVGKYIARCIGTTVARNQL